MCACTWTMAKSASLTTTGDLWWRRPLSIPTVLSTCTMRFSPRVCPRSTSRSTSCPPMNPTARRHTYHQPHTYPPPPSSFFEHQDEQYLLPPHILFFPSYSSVRNNRSSHVCKCHKLASFIYPHQSIPPNLTNPPTPTSHL